MHSLTLLPHLLISSNVIWLGQILFTMPFANKVERKIPSCALLIFQVIFSLCVYKEEAGAQTLLLLLEFICWWTSSQSQLDSVECLPILFSSAHTSYCFVRVGRCYLAQPWEFRIKIEVISKSESLGCLPILLSSHELLFG